MTRILVTHPGRHGDALWSLATARAISETVDAPVDFMLPKKYSAIKELLEQQPYINQVLVSSNWEVIETAPMTPRVPPHIPGEYRLVVHLGYVGWPQAQVAQDIWNIAETQVPSLRGLELDRPWLTVKEPIKCDVAVGFSDEWVELKAGVLCSILAARNNWDICVAARHPHARFTREWAWEAWGYYTIDPSFLDTARLIAGAKVFLGCLSSPWVIANALGKRTVIMEPSEPRWNPIFWRESPLNHLCRGGDGRPTFDAREVVHRVRVALLEEGVKALKEKQG